MELGSIVQFLANKSILVTGATGFLAKIFIEKILRVQPNVKKLYVLLRASDTKSAMTRFNNENVFLRYSREIVEKNIGLHLSTITSEGEKRCKYEITLVVGAGNYDRKWLDPSSFSEVMAKELFRVLKEKHGGNLNSLVSEKIIVVAGDISLENLGVKDSSGLLQEMWKQVDVVVNLAANTNFDDRYDVLLGINTFGAKHVLNFSKKCDKLKVLVHVSTAYVSGEKEGLILEAPFKMGETLINGTSGLDIEAEKKLVDDTLKHLKADNCSQDIIKSNMKDLGLQRARKFGWPNTYVFTKAMGEMLLGQLKENLPLVIIRPTIVTSTYKEPFSGWAEGVRTIDSFVVGYGKGKITCFLGNPKTVIDAIPADMVVNAMIVAMVAHANQPHESIYHIGSSVSNPLEFGSIQDYGQRYFAKNPWINKEGRPVIVGNVKMLNSMDSFRRYLAIHYLLPLKGLQIVNTACCQFFKGLYLEQCRKIKFVLRLVELYAPYLFLKGFYDDMNTEKLRIAAKESGLETDVFYFDPKIINWEDYFMNTHIPGVVKYVLK